MSRRKQSRPVKIDAEEKVENFEQPSTSAKEILIKSALQEIKQDKEIENSRKRRFSPENSLPIDEKRKANVSKNSGNPLEALEKSLLKIQPQIGNAVDEKAHSRDSRNKMATFSTIPATFPSSSSDGLCSLYKFVASISPAERSSPKSHQEETCSILRCLECGQAFSQMEHLVAHMTATRHFAPLTQRAANQNNGWSSSFSNQSTRKPQSTHPTTERPKASPISKSKNGEPIANQQMEKVKAFSPTIFSNLLPPGIALACSHCGETAENIGDHLKKEHMVEIENLSDWLTHIRMVAVTSKKGHEAEDLKKTSSKTSSRTSLASPHLSSLIHMIDSVNNTV